MEKRTVPSLFALAGRKWRGVPVGLIRNIQKAASAFFVAWCNMRRIRQTLRVTPAMGAGITGYIWSVGELFSFGTEMEK
jgi:hypothetical protein